jgi:UDP-N-acetylglucosamine 3-dehydrogenase
MPECAKVFREQEEYELLKECVKGLNLAVVGAGYWGRKVVTEYLQLAKVDPKFNLLYVCDLKEGNLDYCRNVLGVEESKLSSDYEAILKSPDVDAVHICTPNETHYSFGLQSLESEKSVLLEKPMALVSREAWEMVAVAESRHLCLQVGHIYRFNNAIRKIRELLDEKYFGDLYYLKMQWTTWMPSPLGRDIIFDLGPHPVDIMNFLLHKWPIKVSCNAASYRRPSLEEVAYFDMDFGEKLMAHVELSWLQPGKVRELNIMGSKRSAKVDCLEQTIRVFEDNTGGNFSLEVPVNNTIFDEVSHFVNSIRDENNHKNPGPVGAGNVAVLQSLRKSLEHGKIINVGLED